MHGCRCLTAINETGGESHGRIAASWLNFRVGIGMLSYVEMSSPRPGPRSIAQAFSCPNCWESGSCGSWKSVATLIIVEPSSRRTLPSHLPKSSPCALASAHTSEFNTLANPPLPKGGRLFRVGVEHPPAIGNQLAPTRLSSTRTSPQPSGQTRARHCFLSGGLFVSCVVPAKLSGPWSELTLPTCSVE